MNKILFSLREDKIHVFKPLCNVLFVILSYFEDPSQYYLHHIIQTQRIPAYAFGDLL